MQLHKPSFLNTAGKALAPTLSAFATCGPILRLMRGVDAYINFLIGKGSGTGWALDAEVACALRVTYRKRPVVFDVGGNVGDWSRMFLDALPDTRIFIFEPSPACVASIRALKLPNTTIIPKAVDRTVRKTALFSSQDTDPTASLHPRGDSYFAGVSYKPVEVETTTIDQVVADENLDFIDYMKMDIEGNEFPALEGAKKTIADGKLGALSFEFGSGNVNSRTFFRDFWQLLRDSKYRLFRTTPGGRLLPVPEYYEDLEYYRGVSNYIAVMASHPFAPRTDSQATACRCSPPRVA